MTTLKYNPIGYQVIDKKAGEIHPDMDASFCVYSKPQALEMLNSTENQVDCNFEIIPIAEGDIEDPTMMFEGDPEMATEIEPNKSFKERLTRAFFENNDMLLKAKDNPVNIFKSKLEAFAKAAEELSDAWDSVDGNPVAMNALDKKWPFAHELYYVALQSTIEWAEKTAKNLD